MSVVAVDHDGVARFCTYADPGIKLFGRDIPLTQVASDESSIVSTDDMPDTEFNPSECKEPMDIISCKSEYSACLEVGNKVMGSTSVKMGEAHVKTGAKVYETLPKVEDSQGPLALEKMPKKPDKLLPCPRCHSLDTKFCYFNNYNVNQPRHFCRKCQRYWTAGGTLRNVPVGAGRRKNKHSASHQKHGMISNAVPGRMSAADIARHRFPGTSAIAGTTLGSVTKPRLHVLPLEPQPAPTLDSPSGDTSLPRFGQESPLCRSMAATTLGMQEIAAKQNHGRVHLDGAVADEVKITGGGKHKSGLEECTSSVEVFPSSCQMGGSLSNATIASGVQLQEGECSVNASVGSHEMQVGDVTSGALRQPDSNIVPKSPLNPTAATSLDGENSSLTSFSLPPPNLLACNGALGSFWPTWPFMNPAMWGVPPVEWAGPWTAPVYPPGVAAAAATAAAALLPLPGTPQQHPPPTELSQPEKCLWVPKTLRIDDPLNAARSSIWTTLGLGDGPFSSPAHGSPTAFQAKTESKDDNVAVGTRSRLSNPAALSRSVAFHENS